MIVHPISTSTVVRIEMPADFRTTPGDLRSALIHVLESVPIGVIRDRDISVTTDRGGVVTARWEPSRHEGVVVERADGSSYVGRDPGAGYDLVGIDADSARWVYRETTRRRAPVGAPAPSVSR